MASSTTVAVAVIFFLPFQNEFVNSKFIELYLFFRHGTTMPVETEQSSSVTMVVLWYYQQMIWRHMYVQMYEFSIAHHHTVIIR